MNNQSILRQERERRISERQKKMKNRMEMKEAVRNIDECLKKIETNLVIQKLSVDEMLENEVDYQIEKKRGFCV